MDDIYKNIEGCNPDKKRKILIVRDETLIVRDEKLQNDINREGAKYHQYLQVKLINMNILQVKRYYHLITAE